MNISISYVTGKPVVSLEADGDKQTLFQMFEELRATESLTVKIGKTQRKRSLDSNAYAWVLIDKLAQKLKVSKTEIYRSVIKEIGGNSDIVCVQDKALCSLMAGWSRNGLGWITDTMPSKIEGCTNVILYYGSSTYDREQMTRLIDALVYECKLQGIETRSEEELASLLGRWAE